MAEVIDLDSTVIDDGFIEIDDVGGGDMPLGMEMLMNDKKKKSAESGGRSRSDDINMDDLSKLEDELNDLSDSGNGGNGGNGDSFKKSSNQSDNNSSSKKKGGLFSSLFSSGKSNDESMNNNDDDTINVSSEPFGDAPHINLEIDSDLGKSTKAYASGGRSNQGDDMLKFNEIPIAPEKPVKKKQLSREETIRKKFEILKKLEAIEKKGVKLSKRYSMDSSLDEMEGEYEMLIAERERQNSIKFQGKVMMGIITALEYLNNRFDPFDLNLDGWSVSINENIDDYDEIFAELHEKYQTKAKMSPELKLLFQLGGSAVMLHMSNTMMKSIMPGMDDILKQNPDLARQFAGAASQSMEQKSPGFGNFMSGLMGGGAPPNAQPNRTSRPEFIPPGPPGRPDIGMSRGAPSFNDSVNMEGNFGMANENTRTSESNSRPMEPPRRSQRPPSSTRPGNNTNGGSGRPEMKGPADISQLLSGLKTRNVNIQEENRQSSRPEFHMPSSGRSMLDDLQNPSMAEQQGKRHSDNVKEKSSRRRTPSSRKDAGSTISIEELMEMREGADMPSKSKRKKSEKNTVSLSL